MRMIISPPITRRVALLGSLALAAPRVAGAASIDDVKKRGTMTAATEDDYQPFEFTKDGKPTGYDQDLLDLLQSKLPFKIKQDVIPWTGILPGVTTGKYDIAITAILVTQERMKALDFCSPVAESVDFYMKRKGDGRIAGIKDMDGKSIGVEAGSAMLKLLPQLEAMLKPTGGKLGRVVTYQGYPEAYEDLADGRLDTVVNTSLTLASVVAAKPGIFELGQAVSQPTYIAWAVQKGNTGLRDVINEVLLGARKDGTMFQLQEKWFNTSFKDMPEQPSATS